MNDIKFNNNIPIYIQIMNIIKKDIHNKNYSAGDKLPSVRELSSQLKVNPNTIQRAYQELEREGLTFTKRGMGSFVTEDTKIILSLKKQMANEVVENFLTGMKHLGFEYSEILEVITEKLNKAHEKNK